MLGNSAGLVDLLPLSKWFSNLLIIWCLGRFLYLEMKVSYSINL